MGLIMTAAQKKKEASKARKIAKALFAKARDHLAKELAESYYPQISQGEAG